jgi:hypothetical protein
MSARNRRLSSPLWSYGLFLCLFGVGAACASGSKADDLVETPAEGDEGAGGDGEGGGAGDGGAGGSSGASAAGAGGAGGGAAASSGAGGTGTDGGFPEGSTAGGNSGSGGDQAGGMGGDSGAGGDSGSGGSSPATGEFGALCNSPVECTSQLCVEVGHAAKPSQICVVACETGVLCPAGAHCATIDGSGPVCIPDRDSECGACNVDGDCPNQGDRCATGTADEKYCAQDCSFDGVCPKGYECKAPMGGPAGVMLCSPPAGSACPCAPNRDKAVHACSKTAMDITCTGTETCDASMGKYVGCDAGDPAPESCNTKDDDCDGKIDNLPNASCSCNGQGCTVACDPGFSKYPPDVPDSAGCPCAIDSGEPQQGGTCATALSVSKIADVGDKTETKLTGTISDDTDVDWFKVTVTDTPEEGTDSLHVSIAFDPPGDDQWLMQVIRGGDCMKEATAPPIASYDFCVNYKTTAANGDPRGMAPCGEMEGMPHCEDLSTVFLVGVKHNPAASTKSCAPYNIKVSAAAGACDMATLDKCEGE